MTSVLERKFDSVLSLEEEISVVLDKGRAMEEVAGGAMRKVQGGHLSSVRYPEVIIAGGGSENGVLMCGILQRFRARRYLAEARSGM